MRFEKIDEDELLVGALNREAKYLETDSLIEKDLAYKGVKQIDANTELLAEGITKELDSVLKILLARYELKNIEINRLRQRYSFEIDKLSEVNDIKSKDIISLIRIIKKIYDSCDDEEFKKYIVDIIDYEIKPNTFENLLKRLDEEED